MIKILEIFIVIITINMITMNNTVAFIPKYNIRCDHIDTQSLNPNITTIHNKLENKSFIEFLNVLAQRESSGNWKVINRFGYMGKYQLGKMALSDIGMDSITVEKFRKDSSIFPEKLQDIAIRKYINKNKLYLNKTILKYKNKVVNGIFITESSILGAAHLVGHRNVSEWLQGDGKITKKDGNGTTIESYLKLFSGYNIT